MFSEDLNTLGFGNNGSNGAQKSSPKEESNDSRNDFSSKWTHHKQENSTTHGFPHVSLRRQRRYLNKVTRSIEIYPLNKFKIGVIEITISIFACFLHSKALCAVQGMLQPFKFMQSVFCSCLTAVLGQQASTGVAQLGRKGLTCIYISVPYNGCNIHQSLLCAN